jgi:multidrug transporter EmrE-like cation transporter
LSIAIFILNGLTGVIAKAYAISERRPDEIGFTVISCAFTALFSGILLLFVGMREKKAIVSELKSAFVPAVFLCILAIGVFTHTGNFLHLKAAAQLPASVQFPMVSGGVIVFSAMVSAGVFKEKISKTEWFCVILACISTVLFAF